MPTDLNQRAKAIVDLATSEEAPPLEKTPRRKGSQQGGRARAKALEVLTVAKQVSETGAEILRQQFPGWTVKREAVADSPAWAVIKRTIDSDLVVMGSHGLSPIARLLFGSVSQKVVAEAECSVRIGRVGRKGRKGDGPVRILRLSKTG